MMMFRPKDVQTFKKCWYVEEDLYWGHPSDILKKDDSQSQYTIVINRMDDEDRVNNWSHKNFVSDMNKLFFWKEGVERNGVEIGWLIFGQTKNGLYVALQASCGFTGFDVDGRIKIYVSNKKETIWWYAFTDEERREIIEAENTGKDAIMYQEIWKDDYLDA